VNALLQGSIITIVMMHRTISDPPRRAVVAIERIHVTTCRTNDGAAIEGWRHRLARY
jgi:hypothetical protein